MNPLPCIPAFYVLYLLWITFVLWSDKPYFVGLREVPMLHRDEAEGKPDTHLPLIFHSIGKYKSMRWLLKTPFLCSKEDTTNEVRSFLGKDECRTDFLKIH